MPLSRIFKRCMNQYSTDPPRHRFSLRTMFAVVAAIAVGLLPIASFGWKGIISAICLVIAGLLIVIGKRGLAATLFILLLLGQFFYPAIDGAREAILRTDCQDNIRKLTIAIHEYESKHGQIPPPYSIAADGTPLHSWRVLLLPFLGEQSLYDEIDLDKPWGDPVNIQFHSRMPDVFCCAAIKYHSKWGSTGNSTAYLVIVDDRTPWHTNNPPSLTQISNADGALTTIAIVESENHRIPWMSTSDPDLETFLGNLDFSRPHNGLLNCSLFDSSTSILSDNLELEQL